MEILNNILAIGSISVALLKILPVILIINAILAGLSVTLNKLKEYTILKDGPIFKYLAIGLKYCQMAVDFLSANLQHKPAEQKVEEKK